MRQRAALHLSIAVVAILTATAFAVGCNRRRPPGHPTAAGEAPAGAPPGGVSRIGESSATTAEGVPPLPPGAAEQGAGEGKAAGAGREGPYEEEAEYRDERYGIRLVLPHGWAARRLPDGVLLTARGQPEVNLTVVGIQRDHPEGALPNHSEIRSSQTVPLATGPATAYLVQQGAPAAAGSQSEMVQLHLVIPRGEQAIDLWANLGTREIPESEIRRGLAAVQALAAGLAFTD